MGVRHRILLRRVGFCWDHTKTSWIEKNQHLLYKSILYCQLILQNSWIINMILSIWQRHRQNNQFCWFLKNQQKMENTFVKQMLIFFNLWCFGMISANSNSSQQYSVPYPHFFQNFGLSSWVIRRAFILKTWFWYIWCIYVQKICMNILAKLRG